MIPLRVATFVSAFLAFSALAYEILWARFYSFATGSRAEAFGAMLGSYLLGIAAGALISRSMQFRFSYDAAQLLLSRLLLFCAATSLVVVPAALLLIDKSSAIASAPLRTLPLVVVAAATSGMVLPLICHYGVAMDSRSTIRVSQLYLANIIGSGAGSLITGFVLFNILRFGQCAALLFAGTLCISITLGLSSARARLFDWIAWSALVLLGFAVYPAYSKTFECLLVRVHRVTDAPFTQIVETAQGVIAVDQNRKVYGGGVYDGVIDTTVHKGSGLVRPFFISAIHANPRDVLVIGVSGGAWTQIIAHHPQVKHVTAVEINPGYIEVIRQHPQVASVLRNPKVSIVIDDGRRWLRRNPERHFDAIMMNTTFHWREFSSALLSKEFLELARAHLKPGGFVMWNCTGSARAIRTGMEVFPHTMMIINNCIGSMEPIIPDSDRWRSVLASYSIDGKPLFNLDGAAERQQLDEVMSLLNPAKNRPGWVLRDRASMQRFFADAIIITDDNLGHEYTTSLSELLGMRLPWE